MEAKDEGYREWSARMRKRGNLRAEGECHRWTGYTDRQGNARTSEGGVPCLARGLAWRKAGKEPPPKGSVLVRTCDTPGCIRPKHTAVRSRKELGRELIAGTAARRRARTLAAVKAVVYPEAG